MQFLRPHQRRPEDAFNANSVCMRAGDYSSRNKEQCGHWGQLDDLRESAFRLLFRPAISQSKSSLAKPKHFM
jgi:hypothetical protein